MMTEVSTGHLLWMPKAGKLTFGVIMHFKGWQETARRNVSKQQEKRGEKIGEGASKDKS